MKADTDVKVIRISDPKVSDIENLQRRFSNQLNVVKLKDGHAAIYPETKMQKEFDEFAALCPSLQFQAINLRRSV